MTIRRIGHGVLCNSVYVGVEWLRLKLKSACFTTLGCVQLQHLPTAAVLSFPHIAPITTHHHAWRHIIAVSSMASVTKMAKADDEHNESSAFLGGASSSRFDEPTDGRQLQNLSGSATSEDVEVFAKSNRLMHKLDIFKKASLLIQGEPARDIPDLTETEIRALEKETEQKWRQPKMLYFTILVCSIGAIEQGWAQTGMNGANLYFPQAFGIGSNSPRDNLIVGFINSGIYMSAGVM